eukprot:TRINITY_DN818_c0_g1_i2.p1 TRINITY_DN818_c0_g1~~TRINITY_DN818_c0_g1_i2.p1  ORF type:complete len:319 (+),score=46.92 TRINITY_DN818_c0_g1_i2:24-959(+)
MKKWKVAVFVLVHLCLASLHELYERAPPPLSGKVGLWGPPTSTIDWCELNYVWSPYIAEFWNTLSSVAMVIVGLAGMFAHWHSHSASGRDSGLPEPEQRFRLAFFLVAIVGVGSILFHMTLQHIPQLLDELPMVWSAVCMAYASLEDRPTRRFGKWLPWAMGLYAALVTVVAFVVPEKGVWHNVSRGLILSAFTPSEIYCIYKAIKFSTLPAARRIRHLFILGLIFWHLGLVCWVADITLCKHLYTLPLGLPNPQLHAYWHLLASSGLYMLVLLRFYQRTTERGMVPDIQWRFGFLPLVVVSKLGDDTYRQ